jgi:UDP-2-acetamido-3-amino-2,3-dideoxy-glucuronate N-acetyltransferase
MTGIGVIGLGQWGRNIVRNMHALGALAGITDASPAARAAEAARFPSVKAYDDAAAMLADEAVGAVMIATPPATHGELVRRALRAGKHVFVEKPLCLDVAEAEALGKEASALGRVLMVGHLLHYHPAFRAIQAAVAAGQLGPLRYIYSNRLSLGRIRREENALWSFAPHDISMILALTGAMPAKVLATGAHYLSPGIADTTVSHLAFASGVQAHIFVSWLHPYKDQRLVVIGEKAMAAFNDTVAGPEKLLLYRHRAEWSGEVPLVTKADAEPIPYEDAEPLRRECEAFLRALRGEIVPPSNADEGIRVLRILSACQQSLESGRAVALVPEFVP